MSQPHPEYALRISDEEVGRYRRMAAGAIEREAALFARAGVVEGARIVDVGCGPAAMLVQLARIAGPGGEVVGVEPDAASRAIAQREIAASAMTWARVVEGTGTSTGLAEGAWDVVMIRHVLFHVGAHAAEVVAHAARLVRPGGHVYLVDTFSRAAWAEPVDDHGDADQWRVYADFQRSRGLDPDIGVRLHVLLAGAGLELTDHEGSFNILPVAVVSHGGPIGAAESAMIAAGAITEDDARRFSEARRRLAANPLARIFLPLFIAVGRRPEA